MGKDVGTSVLTGATDERFEIVKWFYIEVDDDTGYDAAADIIARAVSVAHPAVETLNGAADDTEDSMYRGICSPISTLYSGTDGCRQRTFLLCFGILPRIGNRTGD